MKKTKGMIFLMLNICAQVTDDILIDCDNPPAAGAGDDIYILNYDDWTNATVTRDGTNTLNITGITLASGKRFFTYEGRNESVAPSVTMVKKRYTRPYDHSAKFVIFDNSPDVKTQLMKLTGSKVVVIWKNNRKGALGNSAYELLGDEAGLFMESNVREVVGDNDGTYQIELKSGESKESSLPATIWNTDFATTKLIIDGLLV